MADSKDSGRRYVTHRKLGSWGFRAPRAAWYVERRGLHPASVTFVNLERDDGKRYPLGDVSGWLSDWQIVRAIAEHFDSVTPGDVVRFSDGWIVQFSFDLGEA